MKTFNINGRIIGEEYPTYIIAEMSANHAKSMDRAKEIIRAAKESGADCVKIQTYTPDTLTIDCHNEYFQVQNGTWEGENLYGLYEKAYTPWEWQRELKEEADRVGIDFFSTPFDETAVDFLDDIGCTFYKIASFEMIHLPLLKYIARKGKPIIMSTGMSTKGEIREAIEAIRSEGNDQIAILNCTSAYPAQAKDMNLVKVKDMRESFQTIVGLSDHSLGYEAAVASVALGARIIEKHFCLSRDIENPDASFSMTPSEFKEMVDKVRYYEQMIGKVEYGASSQEKDSIVFRRSVFAVKDIQKGERFTQDNVRIIRPGYGLKPKYLEDLLGTVAREDIAYGQPISFSHFPEGAVLFLTNNENTNPLYTWLMMQDEPVIQISNKIYLEMIKEINPSFIVSFNYKHIIPESVIEYMGDRIINLHTSYLPYNRGSSPNFFSFYDNTKKGVTIHRVAKGLDTGDILCQKEFEFDESVETFSSSYEYLLNAIVELFKEKWMVIKSGELKAVPQSGVSTYHTMKELQEIKKAISFEWDDTIADFRCKKDSWI